MGDVESWKRWRRLREEGLAADYGWLGVTSYQWLPPEPGRLELVPGLWSAGRAGPESRYDAGTPVARVSAAAGEGLREHYGSGAPVDGSLERAVDEDESAYWVEYGTTLVELGLRGGRYMVRTRQKRSERMDSFRGVPTFDYDPGWVVAGRFEPYPAPRVEGVGSFRADTLLATTTVGDVVFRAGGREQRLAAEESVSGDLTIGFHDLTNGATTPAWRFLSVKAPGPDGSVVLDFNRTLDYPFAFTAFAVCPAPLPRNRLDLAVTAGEKNP